MADLVDFLVDKLPIQNLVAASKTINDFVQPKQQQQEPFSLPDYVASSTEDPYLTAAMLGNIDVETGGTYDYKQKQVGGGTGEGLFQFTYAPMKQAYSKFLKGTEQQDGAKSQVDFMNSIINSDDYYDIGAGNRKKLFDAVVAEDLDKITTVFSENVLRPGKAHLDRRIQSAKSWFDKL